jgi:hypothetical protein
MHGIYAEERHGVSASPPVVVYGENDDTDRSVATRQYHYGSSTTFADTAPRVKFSTVQRFGAQAIAIGSGVALINRVAGSDTYAVVEFRDAHGRRARRGRAQGDLGSETVVRQPITLRRAVG